MRDKERETEENNKSHQAHQFRKGTEPIPSSALPRRAGAPTKKGPEGSTVFHWQRATLNEEFKKDPTRYSTLLWEADLQAHYRERAPLTLGYMYL